jgi:hypothetical protein
MPWPGRAAVRVSLIWIEKIKTSQLVVLGNKEVGYISSFLTEETDNLVPYSLSGPYKSFKGVTVVGNDLFTVSEAEYKLYIDSNKRNGSVIKPFLVGANLTSTPEVSPARLIIDFGDMSENEAASYKEPFRHVLERVRPFRMTVKRKAHRERWRQYGDVRQGLRSATESLQRVLVSGQTVKYLCFVWCPSIWVFDQKCVVIATDRDDVCAILSSSFFDSWARKYCATLGETLSFTPSDAFDTFPFPERVDVLSNLGAEFHEERRLIMLARQEGLTTIYNRLHNPKDTSKDINLLRALHAKMDQDVATSYSWGGIEFEHGFHQRKEGIRFTISEKARVEMLQRLLQLNHERHKEEALQGLRVQNRKKK